MLRHEGNDRTIGIDVRLAGLLAFIAGSLNAAGFHAAGFFSANMTGNVSALSDHLALGHAGLAMLFSGIIAAYIVGAFASALIIELGRRRSDRPVYAISIAVEGILLIPLALLDLSPLHSGTVLICALSFLMGLQNAATTRISNARVRTTHVSGVATDAGIALALLVTRAADANSTAFVSRLPLYLVTLASFAAGGVVGVLCYMAIGGGLLLVAGGVLLAIAAIEARAA